MLQMFFASPNTAAKNDVFARRDGYAAHRRHLETTHTELALYVVVACLCAILVVVLYLCLRNQLDSVKDEESVGRRQSTSDSISKGARSLTDKVSMGLLRLLKHHPAESDTDVECKASGSSPATTEHYQKHRRGQADRYGTETPVTQSITSDGARCDRSGARSGSGWRPLKLWEGGELSRSSDRSSFPGKYGRETEQPLASTSSHDLEKLAKDNEMLKETKKRLEDDLAEARARYSSLEGRRESIGQCLSPRSPFSSYNFGGDSSPISNRQREMIMRLMKRVVSETQANKALEEELQKKTSEIEELQKKVEMLLADNMVSSRTSNCMASTGGSMQDPRYKSSSSRLKSPPPPTSSATFSPPRAPLPRAGSAFPYHATSSRLASPAPSMGKMASGSTRTSSVQVHQRTQAQFPYPQRAISAHRNLSGPHAGKTGSPEPRQGRKPSGLYPRKPGSPEHRLHRGQ